MDAIYMTWGPVFMYLGGHHLTLQMLSTKSFNMVYTFLHNMGVLWKHPCHNRIDKEFTYNMSYTHTYIQTYLLPTTLFNRIRWNYNKRVKEIE